MGVFSASISDWKFPESIESRQKPLKASEFVTRLYCYTNLLGNCQRFTYFNRKYLRYVKSAPKLNLSEAGEISLRFVGTAVLSSLIIASWYGR